MVKVGQQLGIGRRPIIEILIKSNAANVLFNRVSSAAFGITEIIKGAAKGAFPI